MQQQQSSILVVLRKVFHSRPIGAASVGIRANPTTFQREASMAPRKQNNSRALGELYEHEEASNSRLEQRTRKLIDQRMDAVVERLTK